MKKLLSLGAVALLALVLVGCSNDANGVIEEGSSELTTINLCLSGDASRTVYTDDNNGLKLTWAAGDKIAVYQDANDSNPDEFTIKSGVGTPDGTFESKLTKSGTNCIVVYPYTAGKTSKEVLTVDLTECQEGDLENMYKYDPMECTFDATSKKVTAPFVHNIAVIKAITPATDGQTKVGVRGAWQPGFTYYAKSTSTTTYIAVPAFIAAVKEIYVGVYTADKCNLYKRTTSGEAVNLTLGNVLDVDVSKSSAHRVYDCDGFSANREYVDMGNGVGMATMNIGANSPDDYGYYFRWGEQQGWKILSDEYKVTLTADNCIQYDKTGLPTGNTFSYREIVSRGRVIGRYGTFTTDWALYDQETEEIQGQINMTVNNTTYGDAATYNWGGDWMMMSSDLAEDGEWTKTPITRGTPQGYMLTSPNKNVVFLPATCHIQWNVRTCDADNTTVYPCAHYWSANLNKGSEYSYTERNLFWYYSLTPADYNEFNYNEGVRYMGNPIRPIISLSSASN